MDEIFSGTNSRDRHVAAEAVVRTLLGRGAIGALLLSPLVFPGGRAPNLVEASWRIGAGYVVAYLVSLILIVFAAVYPLRIARPSYVR